MILQPVQFTLYMSDELHTSMSQVNSLTTGDSILLYVMVCWTVSNGLKLCKLIDGILCHSLDGSITASDTSRLNVCMHMKFHGKKYSQATVLI